MLLKYPMRMSPLPPFPHNFMHYLQSTMRNVIFIHNMVTWATFVDDFAYYIYDTFVCHTTVVSFFAGNFSCQYLQCKDANVKLL